MRPESARPRAQKRGGRPRPPALTNLDALVFGIQDIGCRLHTYVATMGLCLEAASKAGLKFFVLDRVNPINGVAVEGPVYHGDPLFMAWHEPPLRHGMTVGELARMFNAERGFNADPIVIPVAGWKREMWFDETAQPWRHPSPNMRRLNAAALYPGVGVHAGPHQPFSTELDGMIPCGSPPRSHRQVVRSSLRSEPILSCPV
jgi:uncharacterized protein YbbC (DUF1343 family)